MSKLVDKLQSLSKPSTAPLGFHAAATEAKSSPMLLVAGLSRASAKEAKVLAHGNVDAGLILNQSFNIKSIKQMARVMDDIPLGVFLGDISEEKLAGLASAGCDFVVFDMKIPITVLQGKELGKFLMVEPSFDPNLVRAINDLDIDGVLINRVEELVITVEYLLICQRFSEHLDKPLMISLPSLITSAEFGDLWKAGIKGIVIPPAQPAKVFIELKRMVENLPKGPKRRRGKPGVMLLHYEGDIAAEEEEEEEEI